MKTSNPALSANTFRLAQPTWRKHDDFRRGKQNRHSADLRRAHCSLELEPVYRRSGNCRSATDDRRSADFIVALVTIFKKEWAPVTAPIYALLEGLVLGSVSAMYEARFHGIAIQAVGLTFGTLVVCCSPTAPA